MLMGLLSLDGRGLRACPEPAEWVRVKTLALRTLTTPNLLHAALSALALLAAACHTTSPGDAPSRHSRESGNPSPVSDLPGGAMSVEVPAELVAPRSEYDATASFDELVRPHFYATSEDGRPVEAEGRPDLLTVWQGRAAIRLAHGDGARYLDPLALTPERLGEHPVHRLHRLRAMGVPLDPDLAARLDPDAFDHGLFHAVRFEFLAGRQIEGVATELFPDGTLLVIPRETPPEWRRDDDGLPPPTHFHVNARALSAPRSDLAKQFEAEILALPFDDQRYPAPDLARKQCGVYAQSVQDAGYRVLLDSAGFRFTPAHTVNPGTVATSTPGYSERLWRAARTGAGEGLSYFGFEGYWVAERARELGAPWLGDCDTLYSPRPYPPGSGESGHYVVMRSSLEPEKTQRYRLLRLAEDGSAEHLYTAPGIPLMAHPLPDDSRRWLVSAEGWQAPDGPTPDPRWQSVYLVDLDSPGDYRLLDYPLSRFPGPPDNGRLYGGSPRFSEDGAHMLNSLYGFSDEGGGLWSVALSGGDFHRDSDGFARVVAWDHLLSWFALSADGESPDESMTLFVTGKEVADDFAMTANVLRIEGGGLDWEVSRKERLLQMVGWNPVPFALQRLDGGRFRVAVETHLNYESSLLPRAKGVYIVPVETAP